MAGDNGQSALLYFGGECTLVGRRVELELLQFDVASRPNGEAGIIDEGDANTAIGPGDTPSAASNRSPAWAGRFMFWRMIYTSPISVLICPISSPAAGMDIMVKTTSMQVIMDQRHSAIISPAQSPVCLQSWPSRPVSRQGYVSSLPK